ncbi:MAG: nucleoid DNA-binding protein [Candidatus Nanohaloarchaea archaeon]|jgi:nucleoid DNA-binding protein
MKKIVIFMTLALALSTAVLANPIYQDRGAEASNPLYQEKCGPETCPENTIRQGKVALAVYTWNFSDSDSDGDGLGDLTETELISTNQGTIVSAVKAEKKDPKFKAGAELSKTVNGLDLGDLDGDGYPDVAIAAERKGDTLEIKGTEISKRSARTGLYQKESPMNKAELIEAIASEAGLSKADSKRALEGFIKGELILGEDR